MLAMVAQSPRAFRQPASSLTTIASMLAPTDYGDQTQATANSPEPSPTHKGEYTQVSSRANSEP